MKTSYVERAKHFIDEIDEYLPKHPNRHDIEEALEDYCWAHSRRKIDCSSGCARTAIITSDYVVKLDTGDPKFFGGCEDEEEAYERAKKYGMEHLLAEITRYSTKKNTYFIYPRAKVLSDTKKKMDEWARDFTYNEYTYLHSNIDDLYASNVGFLNGRSIVIDYAQRVEEA